MSAEQAYNLGFDCGLNGANTTNSHFSIFSNKENTEAWSKGKSNGEKSKNGFVPVIIDHMALIKLK